MSEIRTQPVKAIRLPVINSESPPGAFKYFVTSESWYKADSGNEQAPGGIVFVCPCGCGSVGTLSFRPAPSPSWEWDGNRDEPTLTPSVWDKGHWHGWLRSGTWESV